MIRARVVLGFTGRLLVIIGVAMLSCVICSLYYGESTILNIFLAALITIVTGLLLNKIFSQSGNISYKEGFAIVSFAWIAASFFGSLPYLFTGVLPSFADAIFETASGFSTTGATVITDIETLPKALLFWRSLTQWLGGMGIIALFVAIIAGMGARANQIFRAEVPGPDPDKITPRIRENAKTLWKTYVVISLILLALLYISGMDLFDAFCHTFTTMATGGFSTKNNSIMYYSPIIQWILILFMFISGTNFSLTYLCFKNRSLKYYRQDHEFLLYTGVLIISGFLITLVLLPNGLGWEKNLRDGLFQAVSMGTTTGFVTADYGTWPDFAKAIIFILMFFGGCAGSTAGNIKTGRYLIMLRRSIIELKQMVHPRAVIPVRYGEKIVSDSLVINVFNFFFLWSLLLMFGTVFLCASGMDILSSLSACMTCVGNIGPGFNLVDPIMNFEFMSDASKYILSLLMLIGRLEIYPFLILFLPVYWRE